MNFFLTAHIDDGVEELLTQFLFALLALSCSCRVSIFIDLFHIRFLSLENFYRTWRSKCERQSVLVQLHWRHEGRYDQSVMETITVPADRNSRSID